VSQPATQDSRTGPALGYFRGDDGYELERAADRVAARLEATSGLAPERRRVDGAATTAGRIAEWVATAPLFGGGTLVVVMEPGPLVRSAADRTALLDVIAGLAPGNGLVFLDPTDGSARRTAATDALRDAVAEAGGETAEHKAPSEGRLAAWIETRAAERGIALAPGAAKVLGERVGGFVREGDIDRRRMGIAAVNELEKLAIYRDGAPVRPEDVEALVAEAVPTSTWAFLDAIGERRIAIAVGGLDRLLATTPEPLLLALLHRRLRELLDVGDRLASGLSLQAIARELKLKPFRAERLTAQARRWELPELDAAIVGLADLDARVKGVPPATPAQRRAAFVLWLTERVGTTARTSSGRAAFRGGG
jgi:DNA polymerase III delta subunit